MTVPAVASVRSGPVAARSANPVATLVCRRVVDWECGAWRGLLDFIGGEAG